MCKYRTSHYHGGAASSFDDGSASSMDSMEGMESMESKACWSTCLEQLPVQCEGNCCHPVVGLPKGEVWAVWESETETRDSDRDRDKRQRDRGPAIRRLGSEGFGALASNINVKQPTEVKRRPRSSIQQRTPGAG